MTMVRMTLDMVRALCRVTLRRLRLGPLRPSWSWSFEVVSCFLQLNSRRIARLHLQEMREVREAQARASPLRRQVVREQARIGGVEGEWFKPPSPRGRVLVYFLHGALISLGRRASMRIF